LPRNERTLDVTPTLQGGLTITTPNDRRDSIALRFAELLRDFERRPPTEIEAAMGELTESAVRAVPGASSAGITLVTKSGGVGTLSATDPEARKLDDIQRHNDEGPCLEAAWEQHMMRIDDMSHELRWPNFARDALTQTAVRSVMSFQLFKQRNEMAALNFYADRPHAFDDTSVEMGLIVATHTALAWNMLTREKQFLSALASRDLIGQAKGILMERFKITSDQAFAVLAKVSQDTNRKVSAVAEDLARTGMWTPGSRAGHDRQDTP
jgi:ANTAR domain/GAF domain